MKLTLELGYPQREGDDVVWEEAYTDVKVRLPSRLLGPIVDALDKSDEEDRESFVHAKLRMTLEYSTR